MTLLKETLEVGQVPVSQQGSLPKPDSGNLRSVAVSLEVPVRVHGSRVVEVVRGTTSHTEPFEEQTSTMIVFPLGGVLKMTTQVSVGQAIVLTNLKTRQDAICRVVKTRTNPNLHCYVEVEFSHPQPGYWGVRFPSDVPEPAQKAAAPAGSAPARIIPAPAAPANSAPMPKIEIPRPEAPKIQINEQKAPLPAPLAPAQSEKLAPSVAPSSIFTIQALASANAPPSASFSLDQLRGDTGAASALPFPSAAHVKDAEPYQTETQRETDSSLLHGTPSAHEASTFGRLAASAGSVGDYAPARPAFGAGLEYSPLGAGAEKSQKEGKNGALIAACLGLLLAAAGGGGYYFLHQQQAARRSAPVTASAVAEAPVAANPVSSSAAATPAPVEQTPTTAARVAAEPTVAPAASLAPASRSRQPEPDKASEAAPSKPAQSPFQSKASESAKQKPAPAVPAMFGALNAHPTTVVRSSAADGGAAPSIDAGTLPGGQSVALPSTESSPANLPPPPSPEPASDAPVTVGGQVKPPQLISAPPLVYPEIAHQAGVAGNVVVRIVIDKSGNVTEAKAISGPMLLRDAAVSALRGRKYVPSKLDGRPISIEMLVNIQFHR